MRFAPPSLLRSQVLTCDEKVITRLSNKASLSEYAKRLGMLSHLPAHYANPAEARYPCLLKAAVGEHGQNIHIVSSAEDVLAVTSDGFGSTWLLEEMCDGALELSVSLLVVAGEILDAVCTEYEYDSEQYVWPNVGEVGRRSYDNIPLEHLAVMKDFLHGYSGLCNFNYKVRPNGRMCIFEARRHLTRVLLPRPCCPRRCPVTRPFRRGLAGVRHVPNMAGEHARGSRPCVRRAAVTGASAVRQDGLHLGGHPEAISTGRGRVRIVPERMGGRDGMRWNGGSAAEQRRDAPRTCSEATNNEPRQPHMAAHMRGSD